MSTANFLMAELTGFFKQVLNRELFTPGGGTETEMENFINRMEVELALNIEFPVPFSTRLLFAEIIGCLKQIMCRDVFDEDGPTERAMRDYIERMEAEIDSEQETPLTLRRHRGASRPHYTIRPRLRR